MAGNKDLYIVDNQEVIKSFIKEKSSSMASYIEANASSKYTLLYKYLTHSDLTNRGKRNGMKETLDKNYLYYLTTEQMEEIESHEEKPFESAKQSNIGVSDAFYAILGVPRLQRREGPQTTQHEHILLNSYCNVYLVNDTIKYFNMSYTKRILTSLNKPLPDWATDDNSVNLDNTKAFTSIELSQAIHGLGTAQNIEFHKLRLSMFKKDTFILLIEESADGKNLFVLLEKNPVFFTLIGETNSAYEKYLAQQQKNLERSFKATKLIEEDVKSRAQQSPWKTKLAEEMMNYTTVDNEVFCPFTYIRGEYDNLRPLFIASHIKRYEDCSAEEAWDVNNGLLLCANADALFDKHMITVGENKELLFSFLIDNNYELKAKLQLLNPIFKLILNESRMKYMEDHRKNFYRKEEIRKGRK